MENVPNGVLLIFYKPVLPNYLYSANISTITIHTI